MYHGNVQLQPPATVPSYTLWFLKYGQHKILMVKVTMERSKVKSRSHYDIVSIHLPTPYSLDKLFPTTKNDNISVLL